MRERAERGEHVDQDETGRGGGGSHHRDFMSFELLRGIAAILVVLHHGMRSALFTHAYLAVDLFFILSGFVMAHAFEPRISAGLSPVLAIRQRIVRLWPMIASGVTLGAIVAVVSGAPAAGVASLLLLQLAFIPILTSHEGIYPLDGVQWSLVFEIFANGVHFLWLRKLPNRVLLALIPFAAALPFAISFTRGSLAVGDMPGNWLLGFARVAFPYMIGMVLKRYWRRTNPSFRWSLPVLTFPLFVLLCAAPVLGRLWWIDPVIVVFVLPAIVWYAASAGMTGRACNVASVFGRLSFPIYAIHLPLIAFGEELCSLADPVWASSIRLLAFAAIAAISSFWVWRGAIARSIGNGFPQFRLVFYWRSSTR